MNTNRTPGPWFLGEMVSDRGPCVVGDGDSVVCEFTGAGPSVEADARLIAAAPEMLEMLIEARKEFDGLPRSLGYDFTHLPKLDALIAKATGEQA